MQTKNSALSFSLHVYVVSAQKRYEMAKFTSFHEDERQGDKFFNIVNYRMYPPPSLPPNKPIYLKTRKYIRLQVLQDPQI